MAKHVFDPFERASRYFHRCLHGSSIAHTAVKVVSRRIERTLARKEMLRNTPGARENAPSNCAHSCTIMHSRCALNAAARCSSKGHTVIKVLLQLSSALLHSANRAETLQKQELRLEASILKRALLVACQVRFHRGSALERQSLHRCEARLGLFRTRTSAPKWVSR